jgi:hypothetical protein
MYMEQWWNDTDRENRWEKILYKCQFSYHKFRMEWPAAKRGLPWWEVENRPSELWYDPREHGAIKV